MAELSQGRALPARTPRQGFDAGDELEIFRRLDHVVVSAQPQRAGDVRLGIMRGDKNHWQRPAQVFAHPAQRHLAAAVGQCPVDQQQIKFLRAQGRREFAHGAIDHGLMLGGAQPQKIQLDLCCVVFKNADAHGVQFLFVMPIFSRPAACFASSVVSSVQSRHHRQTSALVKCRPTFPIKGASPCHAMTPLI